MPTSRPTGLADARSQWLTQSAERAEFVHLDELGARIVKGSTGMVRQALAEELCLVTIAAYWNAVQRRQGMSVDMPPPPADRVRAVLPAGARQAAERAGAAAADLDGPTAGYLIGRIYSAMLPEDLRARFGVFYTPPALVARLLDRATAAGVDWCTARIIDPACGGGAFLAPVAQRIAEAMRGADPASILASIADRLRGFELDPFSAWTSQVFAEIALAPLYRRASDRLPNIIEVGDSLRRQTPAPGFDLVIGNPPYGRVTLPGDLRATYGRGLYGHANLYGLFTDLALRLVRPKGLIAFVTPASFLAGEYFKRLRALLGREAPPVNIDFVAARKNVFDDVLQETVLTLFRRGSERTTATVHLLDWQGGNMAAARNGRFILPADAEQPWFIPRNAKQRPLVEALRRFSHRLADYGYAVSTGPLVWNRHKPQLATTAADGALPLLWAECVTADGRFLFRAEKRNHAPYFRPQPGDDWLITRRPCILLQRTTAKEQDRRLIAAELPAEFLRSHGAVVVENHLNMIRPTVERPTVAPAVLVALLNSTAVDQAFRCLNGSVAVSAFELESLPLPPPSALRPLASLVGRGAARADLDDAVSRVFRVETAD